MEAAGLYGNGIHSLDEHEEIPPLVIQITRFKCKSIVLALGLPITNPPDHRYLDVGRDIVASLQKFAKCRCGYCHIADVESHEQDDHMESFFLSETVKYLWLLFDLAAGGDNLVEKGPHPYILNTEGHFLPMSPEISLPSELCNQAGSSCRERIVERLVDAKSQLMIEIEESRKAEEESAITGDCNVDSESGSQTCSITQHDGENRGIEDRSPAESSQTGMCPKPNLWRQLGLTLAVQFPTLTRAKSTTTPAKPSEGNLISVGKMAQAGSALEKHARELLTQILKGSRSIVGDNGNTLASFKVIRDAETGEITLRGDDEETGALVTLRGLDEAKPLRAADNEEVGAITLQGDNEEACAVPLQGDNEDAGAGRDRGYSATKCFCGGRYSTQVMLEPEKETRVLVCRSTLIAKLECETVMMLLQLQEIIWIWGLPVFDLHG